MASFDAGILAILIILGIAGLFTLIAIAIHFICYLKDENCPGFGYSGIADWHARQTFKMLEAINKSHASNKPASERRL